MTVSKGFTVSLNYSTEALQPTLSRYQSVSAWVDEHEVGSAKNMERLRTRLQGIKPKRNPITLSLAIEAQCEEWLHDLQGEEQIDAMERPRVNVCLHTPSDPALFTVFLLKTPLPTWKGRRPSTKVAQATRFLAALIEKNGGKLTIPESAFRQTDDDPQISVEYVGGKGKFILTTKPAP